MTHRAYSRLDIRSVSDEQWVIEGVATTPSPDRYGDIVDPMGAKFTTPMPLLWQHDSQAPVGEVTFAKPSKSGIPFKARIFKPEGLLSLELRERLTMAWESVKIGLVKAVSIGFAPLKWAWMESGGIEFQEWEWLELSAVTIPANAEATITTIRSIDRQARGLPAADARGDDPVARLAQFGASLEALGRMNTATAEAATGRTGGSDPAPAPAPAAAPRQGPRTVKVQTTPTPPKEGAMKTIAEQIAAFEATRQAKAARMTEIQSKAAEEGRTKEAAEREEFDTLGEEIEAIDAELKDLRSLEKLNVSRAVAVQGVNTVEDGSRIRTAGGSVMMAARPAKGVAFTRLIGAKYLAQKLHRPAADIARRWKDTPEVENVLRAMEDDYFERAAVAVGTTLDTTFAEPLVQLNTMTGEFIDLLRAKEIIGRISNFAPAEFNIKVPRGTGDPTAYWVGQGNVKPLSRMAFDSVTLGFAKVAGIVPMTEELLRFSTPSAEVQVRDGLIHSLAYLTDRDFLDPTKTASTNISPASVTNGVTAIAASGTTADALRADLADMLQGFADANEDPSGITIVMTPTQALNIGLMRNSLGQKEFPDISMAGGFLEGFPVITSTNIAATGGSPTDGYPIVAINAPNIYLAQGGVEVDMSREASLQMDDSPDSPETASTVLVSLWQRNYVAIKAERYINWAKKHSTSVQLINYAKYAA